MDFSKVTIIMRGYTLEEVELVAKVLESSKFIKNIEVTLNTEGAFEIIKHLSDKYSDTLNIGAGTVLNQEMLVKAVNAGAKFILSPTVMSQEMIDYCGSKNIISIPGAYSASEIYDMHTKGADIIKVFPSNELSKSYAKKVCEPLGKIQLMAVGGVNRDNVKEFYAGGYSHVGSAGGVFNGDDIRSGNIEALKKSLDLFEKEL